MSQLTTNNNNKDKRPPRNTGEDNILGNRIKAICIEKELSYGKLAKLLGKSKTTVIGYVHGYRFPLMRDIDELANILDTSVSYLIGETDIPGPPVTYKTLPQTISELIKHGDFHKDGEIVSQQELEAYVAFLEEELERINKNKEDNPTDNEEQQDKKA